MVLLNFSLFSETGIFLQFCLQLTYCSTKPFHVYCLEKTAVEAPKSTSKIHVIYLFFSGTVAIWNLLTESPLLKGTVGDGTQTFRECRTFG